VSGLWGVGDCCTMDRNDREIRRVGGVSCEFLENLGLLLLMVVVLGSSRGCISDFGVGVDGAVLPGLFVAVTTLRIAMAPRSTTTLLLCYYVDGGNNGSPTSRDFRDCRCRVDRIAVGCFRRGTTVGVSRRPPGRARSVDIPTKHSDDYKQQHHGHCCQDSGHI
jgi:hypothetical protein